MSKIILMYDRKQNEFKSYNLRLFSVTILISEYYGPFLFNCWLNFKFALKSRYTCYILIMHGVCSTFFDKDLGFRGRGVFSASLFIRVIDQPWYLSHLFLTPTVHRHFSITFNLHFSECFLS